MDTPIFTSVFLHHHLHFITLLIISSISTMKDFAQQYLSQPKDPSLHRDPLLYLTKQVEQQIIEMQTQSISNMHLSNLIAIAVTAPLQTIVTSLQLSVKPHKNIYTEPASASKQLAKINTSLTLQEKRKMELALRSGQDHKPYTAPVYDGYLGTIRGLARQGPLAFFKGLAFRCVHNLGHFYALSQIPLISNKSGTQQAANLLISLCKIYALQTLVDVSLNFFHILENRYILQNNLTQFRVFRNASRVFRKLMLRKQLLIGSRYHFLANIPQTFLRIPFYLSLGTYNPNLIFTYYFSELFLYPFNTAFKRVVCQHTQIPGMIPLRYKSVGHAVRVIFSEQGILGLYKGFGLHQVAVASRFGILIGVRQYVRKGAEMLE